MESKRPLHRQKKHRHVPIEALEQRRMLNVVANVTINTNQTFQTIEGFGAGMIPWNLLPEYTDPAFYDRIVNDLGATAARSALLPLAEKSNDDNDPNHFNWSAYDPSALAEPFGFFK